MDKQDIEEHTRNAIAMVRMFPFITMQWCARTYDEKEIFRGDVVTVSVNLKRWHEPWNFDQKEGVFIERIEPPELEAKRKRKKARDETKETTTKSDITSGVVDEADEEKRPDADSSWVKDGQDYDEEHGLDFLDSDMKDDRRMQILRLNSPVVHVKRFPFRVREKWCIMLVDKMIPAVIDQVAIPALNNLSKVKLHFRIDRPAGIYPYALVCKCDSYLGADKSVEFQIKVLELTEEEKTRRVKAAEEQPDYGIAEEAGFFSLEAETKWYYLWNENIWEMFLTLFLLYFIYLIILQTSWGRSYVQPVGDFVYNNAVYPTVSFAYVQLAPVANPVLEAVHNKTGVDVYRWWWGLDFDQEDKIDDESEDAEEQQEEQSEGGESEEQQDEDSDKQET
jgi:hypothetical protein